MSKRLIYLFGDPGTGKITTARILQRRLGWKLFWLHDLDTVCQIVGRYPLPRLMDKISLAVLDELMDGRDLIYVRPSRDPETRQGVRELAESKGYRIYPVRLWAGYETLVRRVEGRSNGDSFRASSRADLNRYLMSRPSTRLNEPGECVINTENMIPEQVADVILQVLDVRLESQRPALLPVGHPSADELEDMDSD